MAKLPDSFVKLKARTLRDLGRGESTLFPRYGIRVDESHSAFAVLPTEIPPPLDPRVKYCRVLLDKDGNYHLFIPDNLSHRWKTQDLTIYETGSEKMIVPFQTVTEIAGRESRDENYVKTPSAIACCCRPIHGNLNGKHARDSPLNNGRVG